MKRIAFILMVLVSLVYGNTFLNSFHFDDVSSILEKPWIRGLDQIPSFIFAFWQRPLVILSFNINYAISGFDVWSYHLFNILFHIGATWLVYLLARQARKGILLVNPNQAAGTEYLPFLCALVFALHPLNTESVTYISSRSSVLATLFYLGGCILLFWGFLGSGQTQTGSGEQDSNPEGMRKLLKKWPFILTAGFSLGLGLMCKPIVATLPAMLYLYHYYFLNSDPFGRWIKKNIKGMVVVGALLVTGLLYKQIFGAGWVRATEEQFSPATYLLTQTFVIPFDYLRKMLFPINLNIDPDFPVVSDWTRLSSYAGIAVLGIYLWIWIRVSARRAEVEDLALPRRFMGFGLAWILITVLPTSSFIPLLDVAAEHRTYLPLVGFSMLAAGVLGALIQVFQPPSRPSSWAGSAKPLAVTVCSVLLIISFSAGVVARNRVWKDEVTLWTDAKKKSPKRIRPYNNLGEAYDKLGEYDKAIAEFQAALKLKPDYVFALNNLGNIYGKKKEFRKGIVYFEKALASKPDYGPAHYNLARALTLVGRRKEALQSYRRAIQHKPYFEEAYYNLAQLALEMGRLEEAIQNFTRFVELRPRHVRARFSLGNAYLHSGKMDRALVEYRKAIELDPAYIFPYINMAAVQMQTGKIDEAVATYETLLSIRPRLAGVHKNLGLIFSRYKKDHSKAVHHFRESLRLEPDQPEAEGIRSVIQELQATHDSPG